MNTQAIFIFLVLTSGFFLSCSKADDVATTANISGKYHVVAMQSAIAVDLNNDGLKSKDLLQEVVPSYLVKEDGALERIVPLSNTSAILSYDQDKNEGSLITPYPFQEMLGPIGNREPGLGTYVLQFLSLSFRIDAAGGVEVTEVSDKYQYTDLAVAKSVKIMDDDTFILGVAAKLYDFTERAWVECDVELECKKFADLLF